MFRFPWNWPGRRTACFCFSGGNETPGFPRFLSGFVSIPPLKVSAPQEIFLRISPDHGLVGAITEILIGSGVHVQIHGNLVQLFAICLFSVPNDPTCDAQRKKEIETKYPGER